MKGTFHAWVAWLICINARLLVASIADSDAINEDSAVRHEYSEPLDKRRSDTTIDRRSPSEIKENNTTSELTTRNLPFNVRERTRAINSPVTSPFRSREEIGMGNPGFFPGRRSDYWRPWKDYWRPWKDYWRPWDYWLSFLRGSFDPSSFYANGYGYGGRNRPTDYGQYSETNERYRPEQYANYGERYPVYDQQQSTAPSYYRNRPTQSNPQPQFAAAPAQPYYRPQSPQSNIRPQTFAPTAPTSYYRDQPTQGQPFANSTSSNYRNRPTPSNSNLQPQPVTVR